MKRPMCYRSYAGDCTHRIQPKWEYFCSQRCAAVEGIMFVEGDIDGPQWNSDKNEWVMENKQ